MKAGKSKYCYSFFCTIYNAKLNECKQLIQINSSELNALEEEMKNINPNHFLYKPVTPQMLMDVLQDPEHLKSGATLDMIIAKLSKFINLPSLLFILNHCKREKLFLYTFVWKTFSLILNCINNSNNNNKYTGYTI